MQSGHQLSLKSVDKQHAVVKKINMGGAGAGHLQVVQGLIVGTALWDQQETHSRQMNRQVPQS